MPYFTSLDEPAIRESFTLKASIHPDDTSSTPPWLREDGHGPVTEQRCSYVEHTGKQPSQRILHKTHHSVWLYDMRQAQALALKDGWGAQNAPPSATKRQIAAMAAQQDFDRLRRWCNEDWSYVGVQVTVTHTETGTQLATASLWGIESDDPNYLLSTANELVDEALTEAKTVLEKLAHAA